jgi:putative ABC transport system permease protein
MADHSMSDFKYAIRSLTRDRGFAATVMLTLAVCIAANTTTFAVVNSVLLRPLPVADSGAIVIMSNQYPKAGVGDTENSSSGDYIDRLTGVTALREQALFRTSMQTMNLDGTAEQVHGMIATPSLFPLLRVTPMIGRTFTQQEGEIGKEQKVILSHALWQRLFKGDAAALGRQLRLNGKVYDVVGVMPADFNFVDPEVRFWIPAALTAQEKTVHHSNNWYNVGRLKPGATIAQVQAQVNAINAANLDRFPAIREAIINAGFHTNAEPLQHMLVKSIEGSLYLLWGAAIFVLLLGTLNIANLVLARLTVRRKEIAIRLALGVSRTRLARQLLIESVVLSGAGGVVGIFLGAACLRLLVTFGLDRFPRASEVHIDATVALVAFGLGLGVGIVTGLMPLANVFQVNLSGALQDGSRTGTTGTRTRKLRQALVVAEIAFAFLLVTAAGLLLTSFRNLLAVDPGFNSSNVLTASFSAPRANYKNDAALRTLMSRMLDAVRVLPGVTAAGATSTIPFGGDYDDSVILAEGYRMKPGESVISPHQLHVTTGFFQAMNIKLIRGRLFDDRDQADSLPVIVIDEKLARHFWPDRDPIGHRMYSPDGADDTLVPGPKTRWLTVVGVVHSIRLQDLAGTGNSAGAYYFPWVQQPYRGATFAIRTSVPASSVLSAVRAAIARIDTEIPVFDAKTMVEREQLSMASRRMSMTLALAFGALALFLSAIGIYGVLAYLVTLRRREIGIRMALGSTGGGIMRLVLREGFTLVAAGLVFGIVGVVSMQRAVANEIYGVRPLDPMVIGAVIAVLAAIALVACALPARRAAHVNPVSVLSE